jgi:hypothetical protein
MKNHIRKVKIALLTLSFGVFSACQVTDLQPINSIDQRTAFSNPSLVEASVVGVYNAAQSGFYDPLNGTGNQTRGYPFGAASIQQADNRGEDVVDQAGFFGITYGTAYGPNTPNNVNMWYTLYSLINQANVAIDGVKGAAAGGIITAAASIQYEAEMRFLRALAYHELSIHFCRPFSDNPTAPEGGVPLRLTAIVDGQDATAASQVRRATVAQVYEQILADLDFAEANLPATRTGSLRITRAVRGAAIALKVRVRLHQGEWNAVLTEGAKLTGVYTLTATPEGPFVSNAANSESIFSIENNAQDNPGVNGALPTFYNRSGRALTAISPGIWRAPWWLQSDLRRTQLTQPLGGTGSRANQRYSFKYRDVTNRADFTPIIRYAEVILSMAEAEARANGVTATGLGYLNQVRNRAVTNAADQFTLTSFATTDEFITAVLRERRIEFLCEGRRWPDIHRLAQDPVHSVGGIPAKFSSPQSQNGALYIDAALPTPALTAIPYSDFRFLWPIPQQEIILNPTVIRQNPNWG